MSLKNKSDGFRAIIPYFAMFIIRLMLTLRKKN